MLGYAIRALRNSPGYTAACIAVLALGIGADTAIFSLVYSVVLKPLPYPDADRLVFLWERDPNYDFFRERMGSNRVVYEDWRQQSKSFSGIAAFGAPNNLPESGVERPQAVNTIYVAADLLPMLGAQPNLGRLFRADEEQPGRDHVIILSSEYFEKRFHSDPGKLGQTLALDKVDYTVIGVLPADFRLPANYEGENRPHPDAFVPLSRFWLGQRENAADFLDVLAKLKPGVTLERAREELTAIATQRHKVDHMILGSGEVNIFPASREDKSEKLNGKLYLLLGAVGFVLLIACANLANLTFARATLRTREIAVRRALGASRMRIILQLLSESFVVSVAGAALGLLLATWIVKGFQAFAPADVWRVGIGGLSVPVYLFAVGASVLTTVLFGLMPAVTASRTSVNTALKNGSRSASLMGARSRQLLTVVEVAMAMVLLAGAGLLIRSFSNAVRTGIGLNVEKLAVVDIGLPEVRYPDAAARERFLKNVVAGAQAIPGVSSATVADTMPLHTGTMLTFYRADRPKPAPGDTPTTFHSNVGLDYLKVMGLPLLAGRPLNAADITRNGGKGEGVVLINQAFADAFFPGEDPLRQRIMLIEGGGRVYQIVGVVANFRAQGAEKPADAQYFRAAADGARSVLILRTAVAPESLADEVRKMIWSLDKELVTPDLKTMQFYVDQSLAVRKFGLVLLVTFAGLALVLAMIGVYSVLASLVASRTREIGIRMALGAAPSTIGRMVAAQSFRPIAVGLVLGLGASLALNRVLEAELFQVTSRDPITLSLAMAAILLTAPLAIWIPTRRATRVESTEALREE
jgi:putative ABC transport system permease protein